MAFGHIPDQGSWVGAKVITGRSRHMKTCLKGLHLKAMTQWQSGLWVQEEIDREARELPKMKKFVTLCPLSVPL
jgi:hypothetical protein